MARRRGKASRAWASEPVSCSRAQSERQSDVERCGPSPSPSLAGVDDGFASARWRQRVERSRAVMRSQWHRRRPRGAEFLLSGRINDSTCSPSIPSCVPIESEIADAGIVERSSNEFITIFVARKLGTSLFTRFVIHPPPLLRKFLSTQNYSAVFTSGNFCKLTLCLSHSLARARAQVTFCRFNLTGHEYRKSAPYSLRARMLHMHGKCLVMVVPRCINITPLPPPPYRPWRSYLSRGQAEMQACPAGKLILRVCHRSDDTSVCNFFFFFHPLRIAPAHVFGSFLSALFDH